jgi:hypothetical protein
MKDLQRLAEQIVQIHIDEGMYLTVEQKDRMIQKILQLLNEGNNG